MRTLIFATEQEAKMLHVLISNSFLFIFPNSNTPEMMNYLHHNEHAVVIIAGNIDLMSWFTNEPCNVMFSNLFPKGGANGIRNITRKFVRQESNLKLPLEVGNYYKTYAGTTVRITGKLEENTQMYHLGYRYTSGGCGQYYTEDGKTYVNDPAVNSSDLFNRVIVPPSSDD